MEDEIDSRIVTVSAEKWDNAPQAVQEFDGLGEKD